MVVTHTMPFILLSRRHNTFIKSEKCLSLIKQIQQNRSLIIEDFPVTYLGSAAITLLTSTDYSILKQKSLSVARCYTVKSIEFDGDTRIYEMVSVIQRILLQNTPPAISPIVTKQVPDQQHKHSQESPAMTSSVRTSATVQKFFNEAQEYVDRHKHSILNFRR